MAIDDALAEYIEGSGATNNARSIRRWFDRMMMGWDTRVTRYPGYGGAGLATSGTGNGGVCRHLGSATTGDLAVTQRQAGANMSVDVGIGGCMVGGTENADQGEYFVYNASASANVVISASDPTNPRIDLIGVQIRDAEYSGVTNDARIVVVTGTPAGVPAEPSVPANFLTLARVDVAALAASISNANITDRRRNLSALGGITPCKDNTQYPTVNLWEGMTIYDRTLDQLFVYDGAAWNALGQYARAWTVITDVTNSGTATFDFTSIPQTFAHLQVLLHGRQNTAAQAGVNQMTFNNDSGANYDYEAFGAAAGVVTATANAAANFGRVALSIGTTGSANKASAVVIHVPDYRGTTFHHSYVAHGGSGDAGGRTDSDTSAGTWRSTAAISRITITGQGGTGFLAGSRATLLGIR